MPSGHKNYPQGLADDSHPQYNGAVLFAKLFLEGMKGRLSAGTAAKGEDSETYMDLINAEDYVMNK